MRGNAVSVWLGEAHQVEASQLSQEQRLLSDYMVAGLPVLPGFLITASLYHSYLQQTKLDRFVTKTLLNIDWRSPRSAAMAARTIQRQITGTSLPSDCQMAITAQYDRLRQQFPQASGFIVQPVWLGEAESLTLSPPPMVVRTADQLLKAILQGFTGLFEVSVLRKETIEARYTGRAMISFTVTPALVAEQSGRLIADEQLTIEAIYGRPEPLADHLLTPDRYVVDLTTLSVISRDINRQPWQLAHLEQGAKHRAVPRLEQSNQKLDQASIVELAKIGLMLQHQNDFSVQAIWLHDNQDKIWLTDVRLFGKLAAAEAAPYRIPNASTPLLSGKPAVAGVVTGPVRHCLDEADVRQVQSGELILAESLDLLTETALGKAGGLIIETGNSHHPVLERITDLAIPTIVAAKGAHHQLVDGQLATIDGRTGHIYKGKPIGPLVSSTVSSTSKELVTGVKLYQLSSTDDLLGEPQVGDGLGLLSATQIFQQLEIHPRQQLRAGATKTIITHLTDELCQAALAWQPRPVIYAAHDWLTTDQLKLVGGELHESVEANPLLGYRGAHRALRELDLFKIELEAIRRAREEYGLTNLHVMLPFVRTLKELASLHHLVVGSGLRPSRHFRLWLLAQTPANLLSLKKIAAKKLIQGVCLDADHLTQLLLGADHANEDLAEYDVCDETVLETLVEAIHICRQHGIPVTAVGRSLERHPEAIETLVAAGITGLTVAPSAVAETHQLVASAEQRLILDALASRLAGS